MNTWLHVLSKILLQPELTSFPRFFAKFTTNSTRAKNFQLGTWHEKIKIRRKTEIMKMGEEVTCILSSFSESEKKIYGKKIRELPGGVYLETSVRFIFWFLGFFV